MSDLLQPGQIFATRYRVDRFIAKGGFGAVYAAKHVDTEAKVALKVIWSHLFESETELDQFKLEARVASRVDTEHVARVFDVGRDPETRRPYLVLELLEGQHFEQLVRDRGPMPREEVAAYFRQIGYALDKAHGYTDEAGVRRPIVHRDLKPENLFLTRRESGEPLVKILDFGLAKVLSDSAAVSQDLKGTPLFMAYEQATVGPITPQTDIWALGLIAFYLLTGHLYWKTAGMPESHFARLFTEVLSARLEPASQRARALHAPVIPSEAFDAWFSRCVNRDVMKRFDTAGECAAALEAALGGPEWERVLPLVVSAPPVLELMSSPEPASPPAAPVSREDTATLRSLTAGSLERARHGGGTVVRVRRSGARRLVVALLGLMVAILAMAALNALRRSSDTATNDTGAPPIPAAPSENEREQRGEARVMPAATVRVEPVTSARPNVEPTNEAAADTVRKVRTEGKHTLGRKASDEDDVYGKR